MKEKNSKQLLNSFKTHSFLSKTNRRSGNNLHWSRWIVVGIVRVVSAVYHFKVVQWPESLIAVLVCPKGDVYAMAEEQLLQAQSVEKGQS